MTSDDAWVEERARELYVVLQGQAAATGTTAEQIQAVLKAARAEERARHEELLTQAVAAERKKAGDFGARCNLDGYKQGQAYVIARLRGPDEALVEAVEKAYRRNHRADALLRAIADTLAERGEGDDAG